MSAVLSKLAAEPACGKTKMNGFCYLRQIDLFDFEFAILPLARWKAFILCSAVLPSGMSNSWAQ